MSTPCPSTDGNEPGRNANITALFFSRKRVCLILLLPRSNGRALHVAGGEYATSACKLGKKQKTIAFLLLFPGWMRWMDWLGMRTERPMGEGRLEEASQSQLVSHKSDVYFGDFPPWLSATERRLGASGPCLCRESSSVRWQLRLICE